ncbi:hypothetical protein SESBI_08421 [Sesbania bispinosa]|nr:hypothetical protein SESBI_08421 [Sesbania bispinosa]
MVAVNQTMKKGSIYHQVVVEEQEDEALDIFKMKGMTNLKLDAIIAICLAISLGNVVVLSTILRKRLILLLKKKSQLSE